MSKKLKYSFAVILALTIANTSHAQTSTGMKMLGMSDFEDLDINSDGKISKEEIIQLREIMARSLDLNGDEKLSEEELMQQRTKRAEFSVKRMINILDLNNDGSLSFSELKKSQRARNLNKMFERLDQNDDGYISKGEAQRVRKDLRKLLDR